MGREALSLFPDNPDEPAANGVRAVRTSMEAARDTGQTQVMPLQRYDVEDPNTDTFGERYWSIVNVPMLDDQGATVLLSNRVEDGTAYVLDRGGDGGARRGGEAGGSASSRPRRTSTPGPPGSPGTAARPSRVRRRLRPPLERSPIS